MWVGMRQVALALVLAALGSSAQAQATRIDYLRTIAELGSGPMVVEEGSHFFADDGRYRHDKLQAVTGVVVSEIHLPQSGERFVMRRQVEMPRRRGLLDLTLGFLQSIVVVIQHGWARGDVVTRREDLSERTIEGIAVEGSRITREYENGWRSTAEVWITDAEAPWWPLALEGAFVTESPHGREIGVEEWRVAAAERIAVSEGLFEAVGEHEVHGFIPALAAR